MDDGWWCITENRKGGCQMVIATDDLEVACPECERAGEIEGAHVQLAAGRVSF